MVEQVRRWGRGLGRGGRSGGRGDGALRVVPLGGLGEIGKNMLALEYQDDIIVIDSGVMFPEEDMLGVDLVLPDISYLLERREKVRAIVITHGHEDHTGALPYVLPRLNVPVYAPRLAHGLIEVKLREHRLLSRAKLHQMEVGQRLELGAFEVEPFPVCHSIPDAMGLAIRTPLGLVVHTGDFKIDHTPVDGNPTDFGALAQLATEGVLLLLSDSTYVELPGFTPSEMVVSEALDRIIGEAQGRVMVATFASLISRVQQVLEAAHRHGRKVAPVGRGMVNNVRMAVKMGYLTPAKGQLRTTGEIASLPPEEVVLVTTGSQGEPTSALTRIANRSHPEIEVLAGDTIVISASPIPGNEVVVGRNIDNLLRQGAHVLHSRNALVHVHGHASEEELKLVLRLLRPRYFVPVHGEYHHLAAHADLARSLGVREEEAFLLEDGDVLELTEERGEVVERLGYGHVFVTGGRLREATSGVFQDRQRLSRDGMVVVVIAVDEGTGTRLGDPEVVAYGFEEEAQGEELLARGVQVVLEALGGQDEESREWSALSGQVRESLGRFLYNETGQRPLIMPVRVTV